MAFNVCGCCVVVLLVVCVGIVDSGTSVGNIVDSGRSVFRCDKSQPCEVPYKNTIAFLVTSHSNGLWRKMQHNGVVSNVTSDPVICDYFQSSHDCPINSGRSLTNKDTGTYYYSYTVNGVEKYDLRNVTILAPPMLSGCTISVTHHFCNNSVVWFSLEPVNISMTWFGVGPHTVRWTHNGTVYDCKEDPLCEWYGTDNSRTLYQFEHHFFEHHYLSMRTVKLRFLLSPTSIWSRAGFYRANVSNPYGWNESSTQAIFQCPSFSGEVQSFSPPDTTIEQYSGEPFNFQCEVEIGPGAYLYLCYVKPNETLDELNPGRDCTSCVISEVGSCYGFARYPQINTSFDYNDCFNHAYMNFSIASLTFDDSGTFYCGWIDNTQPAIKYYVNVSLSVAPHRLMSTSKKLHLDINISLLCIPLCIGCVVILVLAVYTMRMLIAKRKCVLPCNSIKEDVDTPTDMEAAIMPRTSSISPAVSDVPERRNSMGPIIQDNSLKNNSEMIFRENESENSELSSTFAENNAISLPSNEDSCYKELLALDNSLSSNTVPVQGVLQDSWQQTVRPFVAIQASDCDDVKTPFNMPIQCTDTFNKSFLVVPQVTQANSDLRIIEDELIPVPSKEITEATKDVSVVAAKSEDGSSGDAKPTSEDKLPSKEKEIAKAIRDRLVVTPDSVIIHETINNVAGRCLHLLYALLGFLCLLSLLYVFQSVKLGSSSPIANVSDQLNGTNPSIRQINVKAHDFSTTVYAETVIEITTSTRELYWDAYGVHMYFPPNSQASNISISIKVTSSSDKFQFPENTSLVSAIYWIECHPKCDFDRNISLAIQHYGKVNTSDNLAFVRTHHDDFVFNRLEGGKFSNSTSYGIVQISHFCGLAVVQKEPGEKRYFAGLIYQPVVNDVYSVHFVMSVMLNAALNHVYRCYSDWLLGSNDEVEFEDSKISLDIYEYGVDISGWKILPFNSITINKQQVEMHHNSSGGRVPHCHLELLWNGDGNPKRLIHRIDLDGAKKSHDFITLDSNHFQSGAAVSSILKDEEQACYLTQHSEDMTAIRSWRPMNYELQLMHWKDPNTGEKSIFRLKEQILGSCRKIGTTFGISDVVLSAVCNDDSEECCNEVLLKWSLGSIPRREEFPVTWGGLLVALKQNCPQVADDLEMALTHRL